VAASNAPLEQEVAAGRFRPDLYYRLNVVAFHLPPLRERRAAVAPLAWKFLAEFAARNRPDLRGFTPDAMHALEGYHWPGNVRQLRNVIERAAALCPGPDVRAADLPEGIRCPAPTSPVCAAPSGRSALLAEAPAECLTLRQSKAKGEVLRITQALRKHGNNRLRAAAELGISRVGLYKKLHQYGLFQVSAHVSPVPCKEIRPWMRPCLCLRRAK
jgi:DNA-binding NtrC family response regulator